ncbi:F-box protein At3g07870 [Eucalyptus grandis]|nr:F-box protein At3g07870 [Eucalyptus grandis]
MAAPSSLRRLPQDIIADILSRLPAETLLDLRRVCKSWSSLILAPSFATKHLHRRLGSGPHQNLRLLHLPCVPHDRLVPASSADFCSVLCSDPLSGSFTRHAKFAIPFDEHAFSFEVVGSVDGLVCVWLLHRKSKLWTVQSMYLWNPAMRKLRDLGNRDVVEHVAGMSGYRIHGFGHDRKGSIYRVVRITYGRTRKREKKSSMEAVQVEVCTVGRDSWRMLEPHRISCFAEDDSRACINGALHWPASVTEDAPYSSILSFEVASQKFDELPMPKEYLNEFKLHEEMQVSIAALKESLATLVCCPGAGNVGSEINVWVMKQYGIADSWTKQYTAVMQQTIERVLGSTWNGEILIHRSDHKVMCCDLENDMLLKDTGVTGFPDRFDVVDYSESLVWPDEGNADG